jgi:hypothetical protein
MSSVAPKSDDLLSTPAEDEEDMTSIMSADQRKALQQAASNSKEAETLEGDTARPPPSAEAVVEAAAIAIPRAPATPAGVAQVEAPAPPAPRATEKDAAVPAPASSGWSTWELVAFVMLAVAVAVSLRM